jgi:uroporphyrinogen-III decarboxylase
VDRAKAREAREAQDRLAAQGAVTTQGLGPSPLMSLVEHYCGPENTFCLLADEADLFGETIALMHRRQLALLDALLPHCVADTLWMIENTSSNLISPRLFELFVMPQLREYANRMLQRGVIPVHHMCGRLKALLDRIETLPALVNEAYTTPPLGDVTLADGRRHMPSKTLMGGTNATLWLEGVEKIVETVAADLAACPDRRRIFLTSAGVLPPLVPFDKARRVVERFKRL